MLCLHAVTDDDGHPVGNEDESGSRLCEYWGSTFQARAEGPRHHQFENLLQFVQKAPDDIAIAIASFSPQLFVEASIGTP